MKLSKFAAAACSVVALLFSSAAIAQTDSFTTAISVNGQNISNFQINQRIRMLRAMATQGDLRAQARDALINERLFLQEAENVGIEVSEEQIAAGMEEFASRANLSVSQFLAELAKYGVVQDTFREFVHAGHAWREVVSAKFFDRATSVAIDEIDQRLALRAQPPTTRVLLSELVVPLSGSDSARARDIANAVYQRARTLDQFQEAVKRFSVADSRQRNGDLGWVPLERLPAAVRRSVEVAPVGTVVPPTELEGGIYVLFKRSVRRTNSRDVAHETNFSTLRVAGGSREAARAAAREIMGRVHTCKDLLWEANSLPKGALVEHKVAPGGSLGHYAGALNDLDDGEMTVVPVPDSDGTSVELVVLCERTVVTDPARREAALIHLRTRKLEDYARNHLSSLREAAIIRQ